MYDNINSKIKSKKDFKYIEISNKEDINIFKEVIQFSLKDITNCTIFFKNLNIIMEVKGLCCGILVFNNIEILKTMSIAEGLYLCKQI